MPACRGRWVGFVIRGSLDNAHEGSVADGYAAGQDLSFRLKPHHVFEMRDDHSFECGERIFCPWAHAHAREEKMFCRDAIGVLATSRDDLAGTAAEK